MVVVAATTVFVRNSSGEGMEIVTLYYHSDLSIRIMTQRVDITPNEVNGFNKIRSLEVLVEKNTIMVGK